MATESRTVVTQVAKKDSSTNTAGATTPIGTLTSNVFDQDGATVYTQRQINKNFFDFKKGIDLIYVGGTAPVNSQVKVWIDTSA